MDAGMNYHLGKPIIADDVIEIVSRCFIELSMERI